jgi:hypothetical protein
MARSAARFENVDWNNPADRPVAASVKTVMSLLTGRGISWQLSGY